mmetsp:Transcript_17641/g.45280  ORF Transcript_17641/g.45280 Transcript_17641/m.45280 type:complete len:84 (+) Transcript_17641:734-985(+)
MRAFDRTSCLPPSHDFTCPPCTASRPRRRSSASTRTTFSTTSPGTLSAVVFDDSMAVHMCASEMLFKPFVGITPQAGHGDTTC